MRFSSLYFWFAFILAADDFAIDMPSFHLDVMCILPRQKSNVNMKIRWVGQSRTPLRLFRKDPSCAMCVADQFLPLWFSRAQDRAQSVIFGIFKVLFYFCQIFKYRFCSSNYILWATIGDNITFFIGKIFSCRKTTERQKGLPAKCAIIHMNTPSYIFSVRHL